jgi:hypothetical protein
MLRLKSQEHKRWIVAEAYPLPTPDDRDGFHELCIIPTTCRPNPAALDATSQRRDGGCGSHQLFLTLVASNVHSSSQERRLAQAIEHELNGESGQYARHATNHISAGAAEDCDQMLGRPHRAKG